MKKKCTPTSPTLKIGLVFRTISHFLDTRLTFNTGNDGVQLFQIEFPYDEIKRKLLGS